MIPLKGLSMGCYALCLAASTLSAQAAGQHFESSEQRVSVVELFTSQGCSSCPPADDWLSGLSDAPGLWRQVIPLAFHVDYWDYLGWRDRFAAPEFSQRQRAYRHSGGLGSVYTPGVLVNGEEWRGWYWGRNIPSEERPLVGRLQLDVVTDGPATLRFTPGPAWNSDQLRANLVILGSELESPIGGGENGGRTLQESFVVLAHRVSVDPVAAHTWRLSWPDVEVKGGGRQAVVAWLSSGENPTPLQAVGGWLDESTP
ncbi:MAG: DUF1223 domain-containing protein [Candidatus Thiodiazotropha sp.]